MSYLYVTTDGAVISKQSESFRVKGPDGTLLTEIEARNLEAVCILSSVQVTTQALAEMLEHGIELAILSHRGKLLGQLTPPLARNVLLRKAQYDKEKDPDFALARAKEVVEAKVANQRQVIVRYGLDNSGEHPELKNAGKDIQRLAGGIEKVRDMAALRGVEGACARSYWSVYGKMFKADRISFNGRKKRPPPDPVNAVLSFGYVLLNSLLHSMLDALGFDPFLGFFHEETYGRPSLALDLLEPLRAPVVDRFSVRLFNLKIVKPEDFQADGAGGVRLSKKGLRVFFREWEKHLSRMDARGIIKAQAMDFRQVLLGEKDSLAPYRWSAR